MRCQEGLLRRVSSGGSTSTMTQNGWVSATGDVGWAIGCVPSQGHVLECPGEYSDSILVKVKSIVQLTWADEGVVGNLDIRQGGASPADFCVDVVDDVWGYVCAGEESGHDDAGVWEFSTCFCCYICHRLCSAMA